ncbi:hypothetical protein SCB71_19095 [Herbiconiux sp. KACC 21604]|uniref:hypothetical protein n=1 Tax=unclassified Herbiconiux TaxID=2618217 RepID=UPI0014912C29|nr:hypothetical protein [Herbiconiux sp. SALV-R1]QJU55150.1 hypothetical protein HL652_17030 [Herbiconiux sp. SALV-R1]WPO86305.1 hypothetical protein SCB71_19095 [Herbiconiux sp. KACC 21604]
MTSFDGFTVGDVVRHRRGHTISEVDVQTLALLSMNTAQTHFNRASLADYFDGSFRDLPLSAPVALALTVGLSTEDMSTGALREIECTEVRSHAPLFAGDSIAVWSEVIALQPVDDGSGLLTYRATAERDGVTVLSAVRSVLLPRGTDGEVDDDARALRFEELLPWPTSAAPH